MNSLCLTGNLTRDAIVNVVPSKEGKEDRYVVNFTVASNEGYTDKDGQWVEKTEFFDCARFLSKKDGAEKLASMLTQGRFVEVEGAIRHSEPRQGKGDNADKIYHNVYVEVDEVRPGQKPRAKEESQEG